jgi:PAS domain S-box-containing protein
LFEAESKRKGFDARIAFPAVILLLMAVIGIWAIQAFTSEARTQEVAQWQIRMRIVADSRAAEVDRWLKRHLDDLNSLAANESVQLYTSSIGELSADPEQADQVEGFREYLRNLLQVTAARGGYGAQSAQQPGFNENVVGTGGIGIIDSSGALVTASPNSPPFEGTIRAFVEGVAPGAAAISPIYLDSRGVPAMIFTAPLFAVQSEQGAADQIGRIVGVKEVDSELFPLLRQPGETNASAITALLSRKDSEVVFLSPIDDPKQPIKPMDAMALNTPDLDAALSVQSPGAFADDKRNYRGEPVLVISRGFTQAPWVLMHTISYEEALGPADARFRNIAIMLGLALLVVAVAIIAVWHHGSSRRASEASRLYQRLAQQFEAQKDLLQLVTDSQPTSIFILDQDHRYRFANSQASKLAGISQQEMLGKEIQAVLGPALAKRYLALNDQASEINARVADVARLTVDGHVKVVQSEHIPLTDREGKQVGVLTVERDITDVVTEREKRARILHNLVKTLVDVVDKRDPFAAHHSVRVAKVASAVATEMGLPEILVETADTAGNLLNLGKIMIPPELLAKTANLTEDERRLLRDSVQMSADMLRDIEFDGPVVDTLRQAQERWDGSGPKGLKGEDTLVTARIIAVANAFVGMVSDRAFRRALSIDQAIDNLFKDAGKGFDRGVVAALVNYLDNRGGRADLEETVAGGS